MTNPYDELNSWFDESIPNDVLSSSGWAPRLLPELDNLHNLNSNYDDIVEDPEDM